jgi:hypothetical protein
VKNSGLTAQQVKMAGDFEMKHAGMLYIALGVGVLAAGPSVQEQVERIESHPNLRMAKAMYKATVREATSFRKVQRSYAAPSGNRAIYVVQKKVTKCPVTGAEL